MTKCRYGVDVDKAVVEKEGHYFPSIFFRARARGLVKGVCASDGSTVREEELNGRQRSACGGEIEGGGVPPEAAGVEVGAIGDEEF